MIIPNLMVTDMERAIAFYSDVVGLEVTMLISADREILKPGEESRAIFATLDGLSSQLMLQTAEAWLKSFRSSIRSRARNRAGPSIFAAWTRTRLPGGPHPTRSSNRPFYSGTA